MIKKNKRQIISFSIIGISLILVLLIVLKNNDLPSAIHALKNIKTTYFVWAIISYCGYVFMEGFGLYVFLREFGYRVKLSTAVHFSFIGFFYANITPGATGGQPMQAVLMRERNIPYGIATSALTVRFIFNQLATVFSTCVLWITHRGFCFTQLGDVFPFVILGLAVAFFPIPVVMLVVYHDSWTRKTASFIIDFLSKHKLLRKPEKAKQDIDNILNKYHDSMQVIMHHPVQLILQMVVSMLEYFFLMMIPVFIYFALDQHSASPGQLITVAYMLFTSAGYTPLPGASGAQEGGFLLYFRGLYSDPTISVGLLLWRFVSYYLCLIAGALDSVYRAIRKKRKPIDCTEEK